MGPHQTTTSMSTNRSSALADPAPTPRGFNKNRRDITRLLLSVVAMLLVAGQSLYAIIGSVAAMGVLKEGTFWSHKNWKWMFLSAVSFSTSVFVWCLGNAASQVDEEKAYGLKIFLWVVGEMTRVGWGLILGMFLIAANIPSAPANF